MKALIDDIRFSLGALASQPLFTFTVILTLALAVGANTAVFSVVHGVLLSELPYEDAEDVVRIRLESTARPGQRSELSPAEVADLIERSQFIETAGFFNWAGLEIGGTDRPRDLTTNMVTPEYLQALGVTPLLGPGFSPEPESEVVISASLWRSDFGGREEIIGQEVIIGGGPVTVVGVLPDWMSYPSRAVDLWAPVRGIDLSSRAARYVYMVARIQPGSFEDFEAELAAINRAWVAEFPEANADWRLTVEPLALTIVGDARAALWILMSIVAVVLLIACANVANMLLARGVHRSRELALRVAVGATRGVLMRLVLTEAAILGVAGALIGLLLAWAAVDAIDMISRLGLPRLDAVGINGPVLAFNVALSLVTALVFGLIPALKAASTEPQEALKSGGKGVEGADAAGLQSAFSIAAVAFALVLMIVSGILVKSFTQLINIDPGFDPEGVASVQLWRNGEPEERLAYFGSVLDQLRDDPRIDSAGVTNWVPMDFITSWRQEVQVVGRAEPEGEPAQMINVMGEALDVLRIDQALGAALDANSDESAEPATWINVSAAELYFGDTDSAVDQIIAIDRGDNGEKRLVEYRVAGVIDDVRYASLEEAPAPTLYFPRRTFGTAGANIIARGTGNATETAELVLDAVWSLDPTQSVYRDFRAEVMLDDEVADDRIYLRLVLAFSGIAIVLACVGVFAVLSYTVNRRLGEFGLRAALGATRGRILTLVMRESTARLAIGLVIGAVLTLVINRWLSTQLYGVASLELSAFAGAAALVAAVTLMAGLWPAIRATRSEPMDALRWE